MKRHDCEAPASLVDLLAYQQGELTPEAEQRFEEHFFGCEYCVRRLEAVERLGAGVVALVRSGRITSGATAALLSRAVGQGVRVRDYRLVPGEPAACTIAPTDDFVAVRLAGVFGDLGRVDVAVESIDLDTGQVAERLVENVAVDHQRGEIIVRYAGEMVRSQPRSMWTLQVRGRRGGVEEQLGTYILEHTPWEQLPAGIGGDD
jgi:anti-sigma factor RsiW